MPAYSPTGTPAIRATVFPSPICLADEWGLVQWLLAGAGREALNW